MCLPVCAYGAGGSSWCGRGIHTVAHPPLPLSLSHTHPSFPVFLSFYLLLLSSFPFSLPFSPVPPQEYLKDYGTDEMKKIGDELIKKEMDTGLTDSAKRLLVRKMDKVEKGEHDVFI